MKLMLVILNDSDAEPVLQSLLEEDFRVTRIASTGGFLRRGNTTLLIGTEEKNVQRAMDLIRDNCAEPLEVSQRRATVFVLDVERFDQL